MKKPCLIAVCPNPAVDGVGFCATCLGDNSRWNAQAPAAPTNDIVNSPSHYTDHPSGVECIQVAEHFNFNRGNAIKYLWRAGEKAGEDEVTSLQKARWYIDREIARLGGK